uniref:Secreted protein n=1 Tax=Rhabditophanes sp. KR3021 TaxID=114890 RepID=A0AC35U654_9BILA
MIGAKYIIVFIGIASSLSTILAEPVQHVPGTCKVAVREVTYVTGSCVELGTEIFGCQTENYLDPFNADCHSGNLKRPF